MGKNLIWFFGLFHSGWKIIHPRKRERIFVFLSSKNFLKFVSMLFLFFSQGKVLKTHTHRNSFPIECKKLVTFGLKGFHENCYILITKDKLYSMF